MQKIRSLLNKIPNGWHYKTRIEQIYISTIPEIFITRENDNYWLHIRDAATAISADFYNQIAKQNSYKPLVFEKYVYTNYEVISVEGMYLAEQYNNEENPLDLFKDSFVQDITRNTYYTLNSYWENSRFFKRKFVQ